MLVILSLFCWGVLFYISIGKICNVPFRVRGGGGQPATNIIQQPTAPAPSAADSAKGIAEARLQYDRPIAQQELDIQREFAPQQAALYQALYNQYYPEMARSQQELQQELYPNQSQIVEQGAAQALQRLQNPDYMTPEEQSALNMQRGQQISEMQRAMRERANLGGNLYGGRAAGAEARSMQDLLGQFETQDYSRRMAAGQAAQQALNPYMQILYPQVGTQQPNIQGYQYQSAVPQADTLYNALYGASRPGQLVQQQRSLGGVNLGILGRWGGGTV